MSNTDQAWRAERLARAIRQLEALKEYAHPADFDNSMALTWQRGSATGGYKELSAAMATLISERWSELRNDAVRAAEAAVKEARDELLASLSKNGGGK